MEIRAYDYFADRETEGGGLARAATQIEALRSEHENCLLFDNGDFLQGNPMGDYAARAFKEDPTFPNPMIAALNLLGLDAATLGNHEFNYGLPYLRAALKQARFPIVAGNVAWKLGSSPDDDDTLVPPYELLTRVFTDASGETHQVSIGVVGVLPPQFVKWDRKHLAHRVHTRGLLETASHYAGQLKTAGADLVIVLCHSGIEDTMPQPEMENASYHIAALETVDAVITGHSHLIFPSARFGHLAGADIARGLIHKTPVTMAGFGGSHVGCIDLVLSRTETAWHVSEAKAAAVPVSPGTAVSATEQAILAVTQPAHDKTLAYVREPVGTTEEPLDSLLAMLEPAAAVRFVATAQAWAATAALQDSGHADLPLLSAAAAFKMGGLGGAEHFSHVPAGDIAMRHVADLYLYPNTLCAMRIDARALREWLEFGASIFQRIRPHQPDQPLLDPEFPSYNFDTITGVTYEIDLSEPARYDTGGCLVRPNATRIRALRYQGEPVTDGMEFVVATNDYRTSKSGSYPGADTGVVVYDAPDMHRDILVRYLRNTPADRILHPPPWRLGNVTGASVTFETGQQLLRQPERMRSHAIEPMSHLANGCLLVRKTFA